jgi:hypothetical protein
MTTNCTIILRPDCPKVAHQLHIAIKTAWNKEVILTELTDLIGDYPGAIR